MSDRAWLDRGWVEALLIGATSRVLALVTLDVASARVGWLHLHPPPGGSGLMAWDAAWYRWIARAGYHADPIAHAAYGPGYVDFAFFPLWPGLAKVVTLGDPSRLDIALPLLANLLFVVACVPIQRIGQRAFGRSVARWGLLFFAFGPATYVFSLGYGEPLFLVLAGTFFLASWRWRPALGGLAMLSRLTGGLLAMAGVADLLVPGLRRRGVAIIAGVVGSFALWWLAIAYLTGDPLGYLRGTPSWYDNNSSPVRSETGPIALLHAPQPIASFVATVMLALLVGGLVVAWSGRRAVRLSAAGPGEAMRERVPPRDTNDPRDSRSVRGPSAVRGPSVMRDSGDSGDAHVVRLELGLFALGCFASAMLGSWSTMVRLAAVGFPAFFGIAALLPGPKSRAVVLGAFALLGLFLTMEAMTLEFTP